MRYLTRPVPSESWDALARFLKRVVGMGSAFQTQVPNVMRRPSGQFATQRRQLRECVPESTRNARCIFLFLWLKPVVSKNSAVLRVPRNIVKHYCFKLPKRLGQLLVHACLHGGHGITSVTRLRFCGTEAATCATFETRASTPTRKGI